MHQYLLWSQKIHKIYSVCDLETHGTWNSGKIVSYSMYAPRSSIIQNLNATYQNFCWLSTNSSKLNLMEVQVSSALLAVTKNAK